MALLVDKQTLTDLQIFGKNDSIYALFNVTQTKGGGEILEKIFQSPFSDADPINHRSRSLEYFAQQEIGFTFSRSLFDCLELYLSNSDERTRLKRENNTLRHKIENYLGADHHFTKLKEGVQGVLKLLEEVKQFLETWNDLRTSAYAENYLNLLECYTELAESAEKRNHAALRFDDIVTCDNLFRFRKQGEIRRLLALLYELDVYCSVARFASEKGFVFGHAFTSNENKLLLEGIFHPLLDKAVPNTVKMDQNTNVLFLTGANMAGKSTLMKSIGVTLYLAHLGFPLPARKVYFTVQHGLFTTINLQDNLTRGYSHFYAEVQRLKSVANMVGDGRNYLVVFDELFRGTNVKDAHDATVKVTTAFSQRKNCTFIMSTHIIEAGEKLKEQVERISFVYLPTELRDEKPFYTYQLRQGISSDRFGMVIVQREGILDMLEKAATMNI